MKEEKTSPIETKINVGDLSLHDAPQVIKDKRKESKSSKNEQDSYSPFLYLYGVMAQPEIAQLVKSFCVKEESLTLGDTIKNWQKATSAFRKVESQDAGAADNNTIFDIKSNPKLDTIKNDPIFQKTFARTPIEFKYVEVDNLVAPQRNVSLDYIEKLLKRIPDSPSEDELIDLCISSKQLVPTPKPTQKAPNSWFFSSPSVDFRFLGGYLKDQLTEDDLRYTGVGGLPVMALTLFVGYGSGSINVLKVNGRIVLNNGFHRIYALRKKGITRIPVVVQNIGNPELEFPTRMLNLTKDYLLKHTRPVLVKDFFNNDLTKVFKRKEMIRTVRIDFGADTTDLDV